MHAYLVTGKTHNDRVEWSNHLFEKQEIKEVIHMKPEKQVHSISTIRQLNRQLSFSPQNPQKGRGIVIEDVNLLTTEAANAFLKTLEDPPGNTIVVLAAPDRELVLETISSRTTHINLGAPSYAITKEDESEGEKILKQLMSSGIGERMTLLDKIGTREDAIEFCISQTFAAREALLKDPNPKLVALLEQIDRTCEDLGGNVNVKIAIGDLLLNYPTS